MSDVLVGPLAGLVCALLGALVPWVIARLPQPAPVAEPVEGVALTAAQQTLLDEGPVPTYVELAARPGTRSTLVVVAGLSGALLGWSLGATWVLLLVLPLAPLGAALALIDLRCRLLPSRLVLPATGLAIGYGVAAWLLDGSADDLVRGLIGLAAARSVFWVLWFVRSAGMGFGDVRLSALLGFVLAYLGWAEYAVGLYAPFLIFALPGLLLAIVRRDRSLLKQAYPFGPFLLAGALLGILLGEPLLRSLIAG
ncbi:A24 family peptidase [Nocardioides sp.]|uniref:A24 family peptidase n=1 Tax=Nocardioides sp. TaxID=35761 RepID=UPI002B2663ED|nr:A24 family peptidase [Nocardioides sp.]